MNVGLRGLAVLIGASAIALALSASAHATPVTSSADSPNSNHPIVNSCAQNVPVGQYTCYAERRTDLGFTPKAELDATPAATPKGYGPISLQSAYKLPSSTAGSGQRIYIIDAHDDPHAESDLAVYRTQYGLPACTTANGCFQKLNQDGAPSPLPTGDTAWGAEISLDLDMASAICPNCGITLMEADDATNNLFSTAKKATDLGAKFVSMSFGGSEDSSQNSIDTTYLKPAGVVYTASTGDNGTGASYPATSANVVAVGGTSLSTSTSPRGWTESAWSDAGSGCSDYTAKPSFQNSVTACSKRAVADVSAVADPDTGVAVYQTYGGGGWAVYGGTSASAPMIAATYALAGTPSATGKPASLPYSHPTNLFDVTTGSNGSCTTAICTAGTGWDGPTGLGTPNGIAAFTPGGTTATTVKVTSPGSQTGTVGVAKNVQINATDSAGAALTYTATGLPAGLSITSGGLISGKPTTAGIYSTTVTAADHTGSSGSATFKFVIGSSGGESCNGQKLLNPGFESGATSWTQTRGVINIDGAHAHVGSGYAWLDGYGSAHTDTLAQSITIPAGCTATLTYYLDIDSDDTSSTAHDVLTLTANGTIVQKFSNINQGSGYAQHTVKLTSYAGSTVVLKWTGTENSTKQTSWFIDDTALTVS